MESVEYALLREALEDIHKITTRCLRALHQQAVETEMLVSNNYGDLRTKLYGILSENSGKPLGLDALMAALDIPEGKQGRGMLSQLLHRARKAHEVGKTGRGAYVWTGAIPQFRE